MEFALITSEQMYNAFVIAVETIINYVLIMFSGRFCNCFIFTRKSHGSLVYDQLLCINSFKWRYKNWNVYSVGMPQLDITERPDTLKIFL